MLVNFKMSLYVSKILLHRHTNDVVCPLYVSFSQQHDIISDYFD